MHKKDEVEFIFAGRVDTAFYPAEKFLSAVFVVMLFKHVYIRQGFGYLIFFIHLFYQADKMAPDDAAHALVIGDFVAGDYLLPLVA